MTNTSRYAALAAGVLLLAQPLGLPAADDASTQKTQPPDGYVVGPDGKLMDHSPADTKSMQRMKKSRAKAEHDAAPVLGPDGKPMGHSPTDQKAMRGMSSDVKPEDKPAPPVMGPDGKPMDHSATDAKAMQRMKKAAPKAAEDGKP